MTKTEALIDQGIGGRVGIARRLALREHAEQMRKTERMIAHVERVAIAASEHGEHATIVAWLHDTLEDTGLPPEVIAGLFGPEVLTDVRTLTHDTERDTYATYIEGIRKGSDTAIRVKLADLTDNMDGPDEDWHRRLMKRYRAAFIALGNELLARRTGQ